MMNTGQKRRTSTLILSLSFTYFVSYVTRTNFAAVVAEMVSNLNQPKSALAMALTGSFITYGFGQLISGYFGDRFQPRHLVAAGLGVSCCMNGLIPLCSNPAQMTAVWCVNGFAQSFLWPPMMKLMATLLQGEDYNRCCVRVSWGSSLGTMFLYVTAPLLIALSGWRSVFWMAAVLGIVGVALWWSACPVIPLMEHQTVKTEPKSHGLHLFSPILALSMLAIVLHGTLRDGVTTWIPSYMAEEFHFRNETAILVSVVLPLFSIVCHQAAKMLYEKKLNNLFLCAGVMFGTGALAALGLFGFTGKNAALSVVFSAVLAGNMHGVNLLLVCLLPPMLAKDSKVSTVSGILNACTYVGSTLSTYAVALIAEQAGWSATLLLWLGLAVAGTLVCSLCLPFWKK